MTDPLAFSLAVFAVLATPGPTNTLLLTSGARVGLCRSLPLLIAEAGGYSIAILAVGLMLGRFVSIIPSARPILSVAVASYLCVIALKLWRRDGVRTTGTVTWFNVFITTLLNPKVLIFALVIIPLDEPNAKHYVAAFLAILIPVGLSWIAFGAAARRVVDHRLMQLVPKFASIALVSFAVLLVGSSLS